MSDLEPYLASFDIEPGYLNWASFGPLSPAVRIETGADADMLSTGRAAGIDFVWQRVDEARALVGDLLGLPAEGVVLQPSTTQGLTHALYGLSGEVLVSPWEFPALPVAAARAAAFRGVLSVREIEAADRGVTVDTVRDALTDETTAVAVSAVDYRTGYLADLTGIREVIGDRLLIVDAVQACGVTEPDWAAADVIAGNGYKWLRAGRGSGFAWFSDRARDRIEPVLSGYAGMAGEVGDLEVAPVRADAAAYAISPVDPMAAGRLAAALREVSAAGIAGIAERVAAHAQRVMAIADAHGIPVVTQRERHAGIVALDPPAELTGPIGASLTNAGLTVTVRGGLVRISAHAGTSEDTLRLLDDALAEARTMVPPVPVAPTPFDAPISLPEGAMPEGPLES